MKKVGWLLVCVMLVLAVAVPVHANETIQENAEGTEEISESTHEHSWGEGEITTAASCTATGVRTFTCACGETQTTEIPLQKHSYGSWVISETTHSRTCASCGATEEENHKWSSTVSKKPTCKEEGTMEHQCSVCNTIKTEAIARQSIHTYDSACDSECNVCAQKRVVEHDFEEVWVKDASGHWYACTKCDEKLAFSRHNPNGEATEEKAQVCTTCAYVIQPKKTHTHSYEKKWTFDESGHWHECKTCDAEQEYAVHVYTNDCDSDCDVCDYEKDTGHTYDDQWETTKWEHWQICTVCGEASKHEKHIAGPEATDTQAQLCTVCSYELTPVQIHVHDFSDSWEWDTVNHWQLCSCGEESVAMEHTWDEGREIKSEILEFTCTQCGTTRMERQESGSFWMILLVILALACIAGIAVLMILLKRGTLSEETAANTGDLDMTEDPVPETVKEVPVADPEEPDAEETMIDDFFASLEKE